MNDASATIARLCTERPAVVARAMGRYYGKPPGKYTSLVNPAGLGAFLRYPGAAETLSYELSKERTTFYEGAQGFNGQAVSDTVNNVRDAAAGIFGLQKQEEADKQQRRMLITFGVMTGLVVVLVVILALAKKRK